jgi:hypothetical protein
VTFLTARPDLALTVRTHERVTPNGLLAVRTLHELVSLSWREEGEDDDADPSEE